MISAFVELILICPQPVPLGFGFCSGTYFVKLSHNGLFSQLTASDQRRLQALCEPVTLKSGQILEKRQTESGPWVYFLTGATVAVLVEQQHTTLAVGLLGADSAAGLENALEVSPHPLKHWVQTSGSAWQIKASALQALLLTQPPILMAVARHMAQRVEHVAWIASWIQTLSVKARLAAWIALSAQQAQSTTLRVTQEHLARMLGVRRVSITLAAGQLREQGLLDYTRGQLHILDLYGLQLAAQPLPQTASAEHAETAVEVR